MVLTALLVSVLCYIPLASTASQTASLSSASTADCGALTEYDQGQLWTVLKRRSCTEVGQYPLRLARESSSNLSPNISPPPKS